MITRSKILSYRDSLYNFCELFGGDRDEVDALIYCALRGHNADAEMAERSVEIANDPTAIPTHSPTCTTGVVR
jgi:hypothetical protein